MNEMQLTEIRNYLLDKKLPIDILMEVQDHFVSQISDLEKEENLSFEDTFEKVKNSWQNDLKLYWDGSLDLNDKSRFTKKMYRQINLGILKETIKIGVCIIFLLLILAQFTGVFVFKYVLTLAVVALTFFPLINYLVHQQDFKLAKKYENYVLTYYQQPEAIFVSSFAVLLPNIFEIYDHSEAVYNVFRFSFSPVQGFSPFLFWSVFFFLIFGNVVIYVNQRNYLRQIHKVKPFLRYLTPSS
ncbi:hypothetical protein [Chryseobacterium sp.]|uniref:hypothetical protein n=1 Tax=Chryseobacterium sp. TaxID=1871047 RepID=UPI0011C95D27|nr:hypothetical protein [Chryseobacterium sp.]TXF77196.1 hypothetical protein FUA25_04460 [Chryseobacterium sp.]